MFFLKRLPTIASRYDISEVTGRRKSGLSRQHHHSSRKDDIYKTQTHSDFNLLNHIIN